MPNEIKRNQHSALTVTVDCPKPHVVGVTVSVTVSVSDTVSVRNFVVVTVLNSVETLVVLTVTVAKDEVDAVPHRAGVVLGVPLGPARWELPVRAPVADADAALPLDFAVQAVLDGLVPGLGLVPVPRPVTVGWLDGEVNRGVLDAEPGLRVAAGVLDALVGDVEDPVEGVEEVEDPADEEEEEEVADVEEAEEPVEAEVAVEEPVASASPASPAAKSFGPGI